MENKITANSKSHHGTPEPGRVWRDAFTRPGTLMERTGMTLVTQAAKTCIVTMPVDGNRQPTHVLHGGATAALAETAASYAATIHARDSYGPEAYAVGAELNISHVRPGMGGIVTATATAEHLGRTTAVYTVRVTDENGKLISSARVSTRMMTNE